MDSSLNSWPSLPQCPHTDSFFGQSLTRCQKVPAPIAPCRHKEVLYRDATELEVDAGPQPANFELLVGPQQCGVKAEELSSQQQAPTESECRPYIEKALKQLGTGESPPEAEETGSSGELLAEEVLASIEITDQEVQSQTEQQSDSSGELTEGEGSQPIESQEQSIGESEEIEKDAESAESLENVGESAETGGDNLNEDNESLEGDDKSTEKDEEIDGESNESVGENIETSVVEELEGKSDEDSNESKEAKGESGQAEGGSGEVGEETLKTEVENVEEESGVESSESVEADEIVKDDEETTEESIESAEIIEDNAKTEEKPAKVFEQGPELGGKSTEAGKESAEDDEEKLEPVEENEEASKENDKESSEADRERAEDGGESAEAGGESAEASIESAEAGEESAKADEESAEVGESVEVGGESAEAGGESAEAGGESAEAGGESAEAGGESAEAGGESAEAGGESAEAGGESAEAGGESAEAGGESAEVGGESAEVGEESVEAGGESSEAGGESAEAEGESAEARGESAEARGESAEARGESAEADGESAEASRENAKTDEESIKPSEGRAETAGESEENAGENLEIAEESTNTIKESAEVDSESFETRAASTEETKETKEGISVESVEDIISQTDAASEQVSAGSESEAASQDTDDQSAEAPSQEEQPEITPEEELTQEVEIPENLRPREHISQLLHLDTESAEKELLLAKTVETTLKELKRLYDIAIKPLETLYKYRDLSNRHFGDAEIFSKPLVLFMGPWSGGKSSIINYLLDNEYKQTALRTGAEPSPAYFNILMWGDREEALDGTQLAADWTFSGLQKFGQGLLDRLHGLRLPNKLLEKAPLRPESTGLDIICRPESGRVNIVEIPGILEIRKQVERLFPFNDACQWFIDRADIIFLVYDPAKLDVGPETEAILDQLKGREYQTRIILNKADQVRPEELMRVQGTLVWNISPLMSSTEPPIMYSVSMWSLPYEQGAPLRLLQAQERAFLRDLREAVEKRVENKIASARRFAVRVRNHAKMVDCYLTTYYNHKSFFGNKKKVSEDIIESPQNYHIYEGLSTLTNISRYDLPDPDVYRDFFRLNKLYDFPLLASTCTYFRGCPINRLDVAIAYDLPELVGKYKKSVSEVLNKAQPKS
uniref:(California timema) hypothetical protein n=1 Tax=Timema californicum TaxID=61474 RepID=A0A7R9P3H2_TIMCA|nr:unnamed protein product [Timema californicum]